MLRLPVMGIVQCKDGQLKEEPLIAKPGKYVVYVGDDNHGELPLNHEKGTFLLVRVDGFNEKIIEEGVIIRGISQILIEPRSTIFTGTSKRNGTLRFTCAYF